MKSPEGVLMNFAALIAIRVGHQVSAGRRHGPGIIQTKSTPTDMVTEWDTRGEQIIHSLLSKERPDDGLWGEEGSRSTGTSGITWVVDPIDGTTNFMYEIPAFAISIAACDDRGPVAGAVYVPPSKELFVAARGQGAWLKGRRLTCNDADSLDQALVATGFSYASSHRHTQIVRLTHIVPQIRDIRRIGSAAIDLCYVAAGRLDAYFEDHLQPWDYMAGMLIAQESGALCTNFTGGRPNLGNIATEPDDLGQILAAGPQRHRQLGSFFNPDSTALSAN